MNTISWRLWLVVLLSFLVVGCASRETREERRAAKEERAEAKRQAREERDSRRSGQKQETAKATQAAKPGAAAAPAAAAIEGAPAKLVFVRLTGDKAAASVFDVTERESKLVGITYNKTKVEYSVKPGLYTFIVVGEAADFMQASVIGGKTYYAILKPRFGAARVRFSFEPVRGDEVDSKRFARWEKSARLVKNTERSLAWAEENAPSIAEKRARWWPVWSSKPESQRAAQTLDAEDGR